MDQPPVLDTIDEADKYVWLLAHMGLVQDVAVQWNPQTHGPLLPWLDRWITLMTSRCHPDWIETQRTILAGGRHDG